MVLDAITTAFSVASSQLLSDSAINSIPKPFDEKEVANDLQKQKKQS